MVPAGLGAFFLSGSGVGVSLHRLAGGKNVQKRDGERAATAGWSRQQHTGEQTGRIQHRAGRTAERRAVTSHPA